MACLGMDSNILSKPNEKTAQRQFRRNQRQDARKLKILACASELIDSEGIEALTVRRVAAAAGYTPAALYPYFNGLRGLIEDLFLFRLSRLQRKLPNVGNNNELKNLLLSDRSLLALGSRALEGGAMQNRASDRLFTGKVILFLKHLTAERHDQNPIDIVGQASFILGLSLLEGSGRLAALGYQAEEIIRQWESMVG